MKSTRCDEVVIQLIVRTYDDVGRPVREQQSQPVKVFRANARDFWGEVDKQVATLAAERTEPSPPAPEAPKAKKGKRV